MPYWYYDKRELRHTPSISQGMSFEQETMYRREGARFIFQVGNEMGLRYETMATGVVYFHRFYMIHTFPEFPRHVTACCCLFLAGKVEETPKKCYKIIEIAKRFIKDESILADFGNDPREEVITLERILLQTIKFDFIVDHPYQYLLKYAKILKGDSKKIRNIVQMAWTFINDSLFTTLCLQWEPEIIAIALMYLAAKLNKFEITDWQGKSPKHQKWWDMFVQGISLELLEDICHQVLDLYSPNKVDPSNSVTVEKTEVSFPSAPKQIDVSTTKSQPSTPVGPPPAKKAKKEDTKPKDVVSPAKIEPISTTQPYPYPHPYNNYAPSYPPPHAVTTTVAVATTTQRYAYSYQTSTQNTASASAPSSFQQSAGYPPPLTATNPSTPTTTLSPYTATATIPPTHYSSTHPSHYPPPAQSSAVVYPSNVASHPATSSHHLSVAPTHHHHPSSHQHTTTGAPPMTGPPSVPSSHHHHHHPSAVTAHPPPPSHHHPPPNVSHHPPSAAPSHHHTHHPPPPPPSNYPPPPSNYPPPHVASSYYPSSSGNAPSQSGPSYPPSYGSSSSPYMHSSSRSYYHQS